MNNPEGLPRKTGDSYAQPSRTRDQTGRAQAQKRFLACFAGCCNLLRAARAAKVARSLHYRWLREDPTYPARFREAQQLGVRMLEDHAVKLAFEGTKRLVTYKGRPVKDPETGGWLYETTFDGQMVQFLLKNYDRKRFGDKIDTTFGPNWSGNIDDLPEELLKQIAESLEAQIAAAAQKQLDAGTQAPASQQTVDVTPEPSADPLPKNGVSDKPE